MNIYFRELRANLKSFIIWSMSMIFIIFAGMIKYSAFAKTGEGVNEFFKQIPAALLDVLGVSAQMDLTSVTIFYGIFYLYFMLLATVHAVMLGALIIAKEERDKTADFLLVKPVKRSRVITYKMLAALTYVGLFNLVTMIASLAIVPRFSNGENISTEIMRLMVALFLIQIVFLALGALLGSFMKRAKMATSIATAILLSAFMLKVAIDLYDKIDWMNFLTPFRYFDANSVMNSGEYKLIYVLLALGLTISGIFGGYILFKRRDISA